MRSVHPPKAFEHFCTFLGADIGSLFPTKLLPTSPRGYRVMTWDVKYRFCNKKNLKPSPTKIDASNSLRKFLKISPRGSLKSRYQHFRTPMNGNK